MYVYIYIYIYITNLLCIMLSVITLLTDLKSCWKDLSSQFNQNMVSFRNLMMKYNEKVTNCNMRVQKLKSKLSSIQEKHNLESPERSKFILIQNKLLMILQQLFHICMHLIIIWRKKPCQMIGPKMACASICGGLMLDKMSIMPTNMQN